MPIVLRRCWWLAVAVLLVVAACGGGSSDSDQRADQVRSVATRAGLPHAVADLLALAAKGPSARYRVTYAGTGGASLVVAQRDGDRRVDVLSGDVVVSSRLLRDGIAYSCEIDTTQPVGAKEKGLTCTRVAGDLTQGGQFTPDALTTFSRQLAGSRDRLRLSVTHRTIAHTSVSCLESRPRAGSSVASSTLCVSKEGAQLLVDADGQKLQAVAYTTDVPATVFDLTATGDR